MYSTTHDCVKLNLINYLKNAQANIGPISLFVILVSKNHTTLDMLIINVTAGIHCMTCDVRLGLADNI